MKQLCFVLLFATLIWSLSVRGDDVIPSVSREEMSAYKNTFGKAISDSRRAEGKRPDAATANAAPKTDEGGSKGDTFGGKVSEAARHMKADLSKDNRNRGDGGSKQRGQRPDGGGSASSKNGSDKAKDSTPSGRPSGRGKSEDSGKKNKGHGKGK